MQSLTHYITDVAWSDLLLVLYVHIDDAYRALLPEERPVRRAGSLWEPYFSDSEMLTVIVFSELVFDGAEDKTLHYLRQHQLALFPQLVGPSRFNRRKHQLTHSLEAVRRVLRARWRQQHPLPAAESALRIVDSAPIPICTYTRASRCTTIADAQRDEWFGVCSSKKQAFFGARCHVLCDLDQMIDRWVLAPASYDDREPLPVLLETQVACVVLADKGYVSGDLEAHLWQAGEHLLLALKRRNQHVQWPSDIQAIISKLRHRVETVFSVLTTCFALDRPRSRSFTGLAARSSAKILAHTLCFFLADFFAPAAA